MGSSSKKRNVILGLSGHPKTGQQLAYPSSFSFSKFCKPKKQQQANDQSARKQKSNPILFVMILMQSKKVAKLKRAFCIEQVSAFDRNTFSTWHRLFDYSTSAVQCDLKKRALSSSALFCVTVSHRAPHCTLHSIPYIVYTAS